MTARGARLKFSLSRTGRGAASGTSSRRYARLSRDAGGFRLGLRYLAGQPMSRAEALAMRGAHAIAEIPEDTHPQGAA